MILGRRPGHGRTSNVDVLQSVKQRYVLVANSLDKWIEIVYDDIDVSYPELRHLANVTLVFTQTKQTAVNFRM